MWSGDLSRGSQVNTDEGRHGEQDTDSLVALRERALIIDISIIWKH